MKNLNSQKTKPAQNTLFEKLKVYALSQGFELLDTKWKGVKIKHQFKHIDSAQIYEGTPKNLMAKGFPKDLRSSVDKFNTLFKYATDNGYALLSHSWKGSLAKHQFKHLESGKIYESTPDHILNRGFPKDIRNDVDRFNELVSYANKNGFDLLEDKWIGLQKKHTFKHRESGVIYEGAPGNIMTRGFPKDLRSSVDMLQKLSEYASTNGFELLDTTWGGTKTKHKFKHLESGILYEGLPGNIMKVGFPMLKKETKVSNEVTSNSENVTNTNENLCF